MIFFCLFTISALGYRITGVYLEEGSSKLEGPKSGGTKLVFTGDLKKIYANNFEIMIGDAKCEIWESPVESQMLSCLTPPQPTKSTDKYPISVYFRSGMRYFGGKIDAYFTYVEKPKISKIVPREATPGDFVFVDGDFKAKEVIEKTVSDVPMTFDGRLGPNIHGDLNIALTLPKSQSESSWDLISQSINGKYYNFRTLARIDSLSKYKTSSFGGTDIQVIGQGFPQDISKVYVEVDGTPCDVFSATYSRIECTTQKTDSPKEDGTFEGGAGLLLETWKGYSETLGDLIKAAKPNKTQVIPTPQVSDDGSKSRLYGVFKVAYEGYYSFYPQNGYLKFEDEYLDYGKSVYAYAGHSYHIEILSEKGDLSVGMGTSSEKYGKGNEMPLIQVLSLSDKQFQISFGKETSSLISSHSEAKQIEDQLNYDIKGFYNSLVVSSISTDVLEFKLPSHLLDKKSTEYIAAVAKGGSYETLQIIAKPGDGKYWSVIPSDFLRTIEDKPQLRVWIDNTLALCRGNCDIFYVDPPVISSFYLEGDLLVLEGEYLPTNDLDISVTVGGEDCPLEYVDKSVYKCLMEEGEVGKHQPLVKNDMIGYYEIASSNHISFDLEIDGVEPSLGGTKGGTYLTLEGKGFPADTERALKVASVKIGESPCEIRVSRSSKLVCVTSAQSTDSLITLSVNEYSTTSSGFSYHSNYNLEISDVKPKYGSTLEPTEIKIQGTNFGSSVEDIIVNVGPNVCYVKAVSDTEIICKINGGKGGEYDLVVTRQGYPVAWSERFSLVFEVSGLSQISGSVYGGNVITVSGRGFPSSDGTLRVLIGRLGECLFMKVISDKTILCITLPMPKTLKADTVYDVEVYGRLTELSDCTGYCSFTWNSKQSPKVNSSSRSRGVAGELITLRGDFLKENKGTVSLKFDGVEAEIDSVSDTEIVATVPSVMSKEPVLSLNLSNLGDAYMSIPFSNVENISSVEPDEITPEGPIVNVKGSGLGNTEITLDGGYVCRIIESTNKSVRCQLGPDTCLQKCDVDFLNFKIPKITGIRGSLSIMGDFLGEVDSVTLGDYPCSIQQKSLSEVSCNPEVPAGSYKVKVHIPGYGYATGDYTFTMPLSVHNIPKQYSSYAGGKLITLKGSGLHSSDKITVCGNEAEIESKDGKQIRTPPLLTYFAQNAYTIEFEFEEITKSLAKFGSNSQYVDYAFDSNLKTFYVTRDKKWIGVDAGDGKLIQLSSLSVIAGGEDRRNYRELSGTMIQGTMDFVNWQTIFVFDHVNDYKNVYTASVRPAYRALRLYKDSDSVNWGINEIEVFGVIMIDTKESEYICDIEITGKNGGYVILKDAVVYSPSYTPVLNSISPKMGSASGGETVTFQGENFGSPASVSISNVDCPVTAADEKQVLCKTSPFSFYTEPSLEILIEGKGYAATAGQTYLYAERWSDPKTWGGVQPPQKGDSVYVLPGSTLILDTPTPDFEMILVYGRLIVEDKPGLSIETQIMSIDFGHFQVGTEDEPFTNEFTITLTGSKRAIIYQTFGAKLILVLSGHLDLHGIPRYPTWTFLETSANKDSTSITLAQDVDWKEGEEIVIAPTGHDYTEGEKRTITAKIGRTLYFDEPLEFDHYSAVETYGYKEVDMRAEVALLTRNLKIVGDESSSTEEFGGAVQLVPVLPSTEGRISYVQFKRMGQKNKLARYPVHFHLMGTVESSFVRGNSFEECYNRAVVTHGTLYNTIEDNVTYNIKGHTYFIEDGNEYKNVFRRNLAIYTRPNFDMLVSDQTPAAFWLSTPDNFFYDNHVAGSHSYGFWFDQPVDPPNFFFGDAALVSCSQYLEYGSFSNNVAHSNGHSGLLIDPRSIPLLYPCEPAVDRTRPDWWASNPAIPAYIENFTSFKNMRHGVDAREIGDIRFKDIYLVDNLQSGIQIGWANFSQPFKSTRIDTALIVGRSYENSKEMKDFVGIITPQTDGMLVENIDFYNIEDSMSPLGDSLYAEYDSFADYGGRLHKLSGFSFYNSNRKIRWNDPFRGIFEDQDGSLTGIPGAFVTPYWPHLDTEECTFSESLDSLVCVGVEVRRVHLHSPEPIENLIHRDLTVGYKGQYSEIPMVTTDEKKDIKYSWAVPFVTGHEYEVFWANDWDALSIEIDTFEGKEFVILDFKVSSERHSYTAERGIAKDHSTILKEVKTLKTTDPAGTYSWGKDYFKIILSGVPANKNQFNDIHIKADGCCTALAPVSSSWGVLRWSEPSSWMNRKLPKQGDSVFLGTGLTMILDIDTPILRYVEINGKLLLDEKKSVTLNSELVFIRSGSLVSGAPDYPLRPEVKHKIMLYKGADFHLSEVDVGEKVLINRGELLLYGDHKTSSTLLVQNALPGDDFIFVNQVSNWKVGDSIGLSASGFDPDEAEEAVITKIENGIMGDPDWTEKQSYREYGKSKSVDINLATETSQQSSDYVSKIYLEKPLQFYHSGTSLVIGSKTVDMQSEVVNLNRNIMINGSVVVTEAYSHSKKASPSKTFLGGVKIYESYQTALRIEHVGEGSVEVYGSLVMDTHDRGVLIRKSKNVIFEYNALFNIMWRGIEIESADDSSVSYNVILNIVNRGLTDSITDEDASIVGCKSSKSCSKTSVKYNRAGGYSFAGFIGPGGNCYGQEVFSENLAHSGYVGWILTNDAEMCASSSGFTASFNQQGVGSVLTVPTINLKDFRLSENKIGLAIRTGVAESWTDIGFEIPVYILQSLESSLIVGKTQHSSPETTDCRVGMYTGFGDQTASTEIMVPLYASRGYSHAIGNSTLYEVSFANFEQECQYAIQSNPLVPDFVLPHILTKTELYSVPQSSLIYMTEPTVYCSDIPCTGLKNVLVQDTDGSAIGRVGAIIPNNPGVASKDICSFSAENNAYFCYYDKKGYYEILTFDLPGESASQITPSVIQSFDISFKSHLGGGLYNEFTAFYDYDKDTNTKSRLPGIVFTGLHYNWTFEATVYPQGRSYLAGTLNKEEPISVMYDFFYPTEAGAHRNGTVIPAVGYIYGEDRNPNLMDPHGTNKWYLDPQELEVILRTEEVLGVASGGNVQVALNIEFFLGYLFQVPEILSYLDVSRVFTGIDPHKYKTVAPSVPFILPELTGRATIASIAGAAGSARIIDRPGVAVRPDYAGGNDVPEYFDF